MPERARILTTPLRLTGPLSVAQLTALVWADAIVRHDQAAGDAVAWLPATLAGDLAGQYAAERELAREGHDRATLGREDFVAWVRAFEVMCRERMAATLARLGIELDLEAAAIDRDDVVRAARTAFVQLYEAGLLTRSERVVDTCPRCATVVDTADATPVVIDSERLTVRLWPAGGEGDSIDIDTLAPELLLGVVAVAVPPDHPAEGSEVTIPVAGRAVPVIADALAEAPALLVPAHGAADHDTARRLGIAPIEVLNDLGEVSQAGPFAGLARFAARAAVREALAAEGAVVAAEEAVAEPSSRCRRCGTALVPRLGLHWFLDMGDLEVAAADILREGDILVTPPTARDELLARAGAGGTWCLSHQVWAGTRVPVATCLDCGQLAVAVEPSTSCGKCMGELVNDDSVLDARFVGAIWPLAAAGWPDRTPTPEEVAATTLLTTPTGLFRWALPMVALSQRLMATFPFARVAVAEVAVTPEDPDPRLAHDLDALLDEEGPTAVRAALVAGSLDLEPARAFLAALDRPAVGQTLPDELAAEVAAAFENADPGAAYRAIAAAAGTHDVRALVAPLLAR
ncbi:MAG TPA: class I tRNA ligase family protein [Acidimicrobiales bacterium]|nr:class I tRNA ligase family protein [Acidimicrobiales bacterium]